MLSSLGLGGGPTKRWAPPAKLQSSGKLTVGKFMTYLDRSEHEFTSAESLEVLVQIALKEKGDDAYVAAAGQVLNTWQCELMEHVLGIESGYCRGQVQELMQSRLAPNAPNRDVALERATQRFQNAMIAVRDCAKTEANMRPLLGLRHDGEPEREGETDALVPTRFSVDDKITPQSKGPVERSLMTTCFNAAREMVLSKETRELLRVVLKDYASWKPEKRNELCSSIVIRWQSELVRNLGLDHRLWFTTCARATDFLPDEGKGKVDKEGKACVQAHKVYVSATLALTAWYNHPPRPQSVPKADGRRAEPWSLADASSQEGRPSLQDEGKVDAAAFARHIAVVAKHLGSEENGAELEKLVQSGEMIAAKFAIDRWTRELLEACGYQHEFAYLMVVAMQHEPEVMEAHQELLNTTKGLNMRIATGLRKAKEAKDAMEAIDKAGYAADTK